MAVEDGAVVGVLIILLPHSRIDDLEPHLSDTFRL